MDSTCFKRIWRAQKATQVYAECSKRNWHLGRRQCHDQWRLSHDRWKVEVSPLSRKLYGKGFDLMMNTAFMLFEKFPVGIKSKSIHVASPLSIVEMKFCRSVLNQNSRTVFWDELDFWSIAQGEAARSEFLFPNDEIGYLWQWESFQESQFRKI